MVTNHSLSRQMRHSLILASAVSTLNNIRAPKFVDYRWLCVFLDSRVGRCRLIQYLIHMQWIIVSLVSCCNRGGCASDDMVASCNNLYADNIFACHGGRRIFPVV
eukprot:scaffold70597_cov40-Attheya_sp.AAC.3